VQAIVAVTVAWILLGWLRDIIRDPGRWAWAVFLIWMILFAPIVGWAGLTLIWTPALVRGQRAEWRRSFGVWAVVLFVTGLATLLAIPIGLGPSWSVWIALVMVVLLLLGRPAVRRD
jgi:hypothetical protein